MSELLSGRIMPLAVPENDAETEALHEGLSRGGIGIVEVGLRVPYAAEAIPKLVARGGLVVGAGSVRTAEQVDRVHDDGARFIVSPGLSEAVVARALELGLPVFPGVATATEVMRASEFGLSMLKLFPAGLLGGVKLVDALRAAFPDVSFLPSGGVHLENLAEYLGNPAVAGVSGSWVTSSSLLRQGADAIADVARETVAAITTVSGGSGPDGAQL